MTRDFLGARAVDSFVYFNLMSVYSEGRCPLSGFIGLLCPKALKVWGRPERLAAARVRVARCTGRACGGADPGLSVVTSAASRLAEAGVMLPVVPALVFCVSIWCRLC